MQSSQNGSNQLFENDEALELTILSDSASIMNDRGDNRSYYKGLLYYLSELGDTIERKIKIKTR